MTEQKLRIETQRRLKILYDFASYVKPHVEGIILVGSLAYAPNHSIRQESDVDLIVIYRDIRCCAAEYFQEVDYLKEHTYDGYLIKRRDNLGHHVNWAAKNVHNLNISIHNLNLSALRRIALGNYETLSYYRQNPKNLVYYSHDFDGNTHPFHPHSTQVINQSGICRLEPIAFPSPSDDYVIGNDMDKLLSCARIIYDKEGKIKNTLNSLWKNIAQKFVEHKQKHHQPIDLCTFDLAPLLIRYNRFDLNAKKEIREKTQDHIQRVLYHSLYNFEETLR